MIRKAACLAAAVILLRLVATEGRVAPAGPAAVRTGPASDSASPSAQTSPPSAKGTPAIPSATRAASARASEAAASAPTSTSKPILARDRSSSRSKPPASTPATSPAPTENVLLSDLSFVRKHYTFIPPRLSVAAARAATRPLDETAREKALSGGFCTGLPTVPPPAEWAAPAFDDSGWMLRRGREFVARLMRGGEPDYALNRNMEPFIREVGLICYRGRFLVRDRAAVGKVVLTLTYRGGFAAYLNGREIARAHLPPGDLSPADDYPPEAYFTRASIETGQFVPLSSSSGSPDREPQQTAGRRRQIAAPYLQKG